MSFILSSPATPVPSTGIDWSDWTPIVISSLALLFTVGSFWWMNWRRGHLQLWPPRSYAAKGAADQLTIQLPLVLFNTGPTPIVVRNLRLIFREPIPVTASFQATVSKLATSEDREWATAFPVRGREAVRVIAQFTNKQQGLVFTAKTYPLDVEARLGTKEDWKTLLSFGLNVTQQHLPQLNEAFIAHDNEMEP